MPAASLPPPQRPGLIPPCAAGRAGNTLLHWAVLFTPAARREELISLLVRREPRLLAARNQAGVAPEGFAKSKQPKEILKVCSWLHSGGGSCVLACPP